MTNNEKKMVVAIAKIAINQAHFNTLLIAKIPSDLRQAYIDSQKDVEAELDGLIALIREEWNDDDKD